MKQRNIIVILGPTASGKSALGVALARRVRGVVVSADSRQVYRGLDRCFGTVTHHETCGVPHYLLRFVPLRRQYTAGAFAQTFRRVLYRIPWRTPLLLVGGSPFYIDAALHPERLASVQPDPALRRRLAKRTLPQLLAQLRRRDPQRFAMIDRKNRRRVERALEIASSPRRPSTPDSLPTFHILKIGISIPRKTLYKRIDARLDQRLARGMIAEVERAHQRGISWQRLESLGLEPRYLSRILRGQLSRDEGLAQLKGAIHAFARRQLTWWRRDRSIRWVSTRADAERLVRKFLSR